MRLFKSLLVMPLIISAIATSASAHENHCDHSSGKTTGAVVGAVAGGLLGSSLGKKNREGKTIAGAILGGVAGGLIGDQSDDQKDIEECGTDAESYQREQDRIYQEQQDREAEEQARIDAEAQRQREIDEDIDASRARHYRPPRPPRYQRLYLCEDLGFTRRGYHKGYALVYLPDNRIVQMWGEDLYNCQVAERQANGPIR